MEKDRSALRHEALSRRGSLSRATCREWSASVQSRALGLPEYLAASVVLLYRPIQNEVETEAILEHALAIGKKVFFPKLHEQGEPAFVQISSSAEFLPGRFGIPEPVGDISLSTGDGDSLTAFLPGVLFDHHGYRLGRGGGWYDRALHRIGEHGIFVGLAYEIQIVNDLPTESWDQRVHYVITEERVIDCRGTRQ